ncbi:leucyl/phenylalanyl-tRNA--protein transferase [Vogesella sp. LIG4]|uniref:leucyl/phenylalanyl-tRNA--protein transferase n=1 Tax=Vogesella sp. LIG4 TaxID=1192162 RepID=UPI00081F8FA0|nr:leucyl/phenylalanyl-tRNA--protein transferase [Vogesella sp. LIG4]SCK21271.1 leucyl/phenylalanyl-tRNA--protein transferase [Vogesella sp. LIG4]
MIPLLGDAYVFPPLSRALSDPDGLLAVGGDLASGRLLAGYQRGIFPWFSPGDPILWWSPSQRMVLEPGQLRITRSLAKSLRNKQYSFRFDSAFEQVMRGCAAPRDGQAGTWISEDMIAAYCRLHAEGHAHSAEVWQQGQLVGGLYGVAVGRMFFGESMFHRATDASKIALVQLANVLFAHGFGMIDCQLFTPHLESLGAHLVSRAEFIARLETYTQQLAPTALWATEFCNEPS